MSARTAFFWGGLGGLLPILANLVTIDIAPVVDHLNALTLGNYVGYFTRIIGLVLLGGIIAILNTDVRQPLALVQLGIAAPALITAYINASPANPANSANVRSSMISVTTSAYAENTQLGKIYLAQRTFLGDFSRGLSTRLDAVDKANRAEDQIYPNTSVETPPNLSEPQLGTYCVTANGKFGPGPSNQVGSSCTVKTPDGAITGRVSQ